MSFAALIQYVPSQFLLSSLSLHSCLCSGLTVYLIHYALPSEFRIYFLSLQCWLHVPPISLSYCVNTRVLVLFHITGKGAGQNQSTRHWFHLAVTLTYEGVTSSLLGVKIQFRYLQKESLYEINYAGETEYICYLTVLFVKGGARYSDLYCGSRL